ncbi:hypothetical protein ACWGMA_07790 [Streptomyces asiaticus]
MEPTAGPRHNSSPRAESLAARLAALTGNQPRVTTDGPRTRIEVDLPERLSGQARHNLLVALAGANQCGHQVDDGYVWAELVELPAPARLTADQRSGYACVLCGHALYASRFLGSIDGHQLYACSPICPTAPLARG